MVKGTDFRARFDAMHCCHSSKWRKLKGKIGEIELESREMFYWF